MKLNFLQKMVEEAVADQKQINFLLDTFDCVADESEKNALITELRYLISAVERIPTRE